MVDLDELDRKRAALPTTIMAYTPHLLPPDEPIVVMYTQGAADILNAYPALAAEVRALRAKLAERDAELIALREVAAAAEAYRACREGMQTQGGQNALDRRTTAARLAEALAKVPR